MKALKWLGVLIFLFVFIIPQIGYCQGSLRNIINDHETRIGDLERTVDALNNEMIKTQIEFYNHMHMPDLILSNPCEEWIYEEGMVLDPNSCSHFPCVNFFRLEDPDINETVCFNVLIRNIGFVSAGPSKVLIEYTCCGNALTIWHPCEIPEIGPHGHYFLRECIEIPDSCKINYVKVIADFANAVKEFNEDNNKCEQSFLCPN